MNLAQALRLLPPPSLRDASPKSYGFWGGWEGVAFVGAGGKTTALFQLARELTLSEGWSQARPEAEAPVIVTATTHLHIDQIKLADSHWIVEKPEDLAGLVRKLRGVMLVTGPLDGDRTTGLNNGLVYRLREICSSLNLPMLIEADGSRQRPLKAPADNEPVIPEFVETVVVVAGLTGLGKPLAKEIVYQPEAFARLGGLKMGEAITPEALALVLTHLAGGLKNIPLQARRIVLLNQADTPALQSIGGKMAQDLLTAFDAILVGTLKPVDVQTFERTAGIILAAGGSSRFGQPKPLLDWHGRPFVRAVAQTALAAGLSPVVVVTGASAEQVKTSLDDLPVIIVRNEDWQSGQSSSIRAGLRSLPSTSLQDTSPKSFGFWGGLEGIGAAIFLLADQPQITPVVLRALIEEHARTLAPIIAPLVDGQRANPVLFDRLTFPDLMALSGDVGGRAVFSKYTVVYLPWHDTGLLGDVDTPEDYRKLVNGE